MSKMIEDRHIVIQEITYGLSVAGCGSYREIKLLEHAMTVIERVFDRRIREKVKIDAMQLGFMPGKELQMQSSQYGRCKRNMGVKERSSTLLL